MTISETIRACLDLAEKLSIEVRSVPLDGNGGLCRVKGKQVLYINQMLSKDQQLEVLLRGLSGIPIEDVYVLPALRELLEKHKDSITD